VRHRDEHEFASLIHERSPCAREFEIVLRAEDVLSFLEGKPRIEASNDRVRPSLRHDRFNRKLDMQLSASVGWVREDQASADFVTVLAWRINQILLNLRPLEEWGFWLCRTEKPMDVSTSSEPPGI
jgi:hypothetical protein